MMEIKDKVFIVTGASEGLGLAISENLAKKGGKVAMLARSKAKLKKLEGRLGYNVTGFVCDVTNPKQVAQTIKAVKKSHEKIDGLINNAGMWLKMKPLEEVTSKEIAKVIDLNLRALIDVTHETLPYLKENQESVIVNISSKSGVKPLDLQAVYCATKYGVRGFTETLKLEVAKDGVKVIGFYPAGMNTKMFEKAGENFPSDKKFMNVDEIAEIISFAISQKGNIAMDEIRVDKY